MATEKLTLKFDGDSVRGGRMDVRELAPSLLGFSDAVQASQRVLFPDDEPVSVHITATEDGSFEVGLEVVSGLLAVAQQVMPGGSSELSVHLQQAVTHLRGLFELLVVLRGRAPMNRVDGGDGNIHLDIDGDGNTTIIANEVMILYDEPTVRKGAQDAVKPLHARGIDSLEFSHRGEAAYVHRADRAAFNVNDDEVSESHSIEMSLRVLGTSFEGRQWRFRSDSHEFGAKVTDHDWLDEQVATGRERFSAVDVLRARVKVTATVAGGKPVTTYEVVEVLGRELSGGENVSMPFGTDD